MTGYKAKYICTLGNAYYNEKTFEYRGHEYTVEYSSGYTTFKKTPAWLQHKEAQERIDHMLDNPVQEQPEKQTFDIDEIFEILES